MPNSPRGGELLIRNRWEITALDGEKDARAVEWIAGRDRRERERISYLASDKNLVRCMILEFFPSFFDIKIFLSLLS